MTYWYPTSLFIRNELHIFAEIDEKPIHSAYYPSKLQICKHFIDSKSEMNEKIDSCPTFYCCKVIYVKHLKQILVFNGCNSNVLIWCYSLITKKWKIFSISEGYNIYLPKQNTNNFDVTLVDDKIILICYNESKEIWCFNLDTETSSNKWSRKYCRNLNAINTNCFMINIENNYIHFINKKSTQHYMVWFYNLLTKKIIKRVYTIMLVQNMLKTIAFHKESVVLFIKFHMGQFVKFLFLYVQERPLVPLTGPKIGWNFCHISMVCKGNLVYTSNFVFP